MAPFCKTLVCLISCFSLNIVGLNCFILYLIISFTFMFFIFLNLTWEVLALLSRHQAQKSGSPGLIGFQNVRSLKNKMEKISEVIQDLQMDLMFMAETWPDPESISISMLRSWGFVVFVKARPRLPDSVNTLLTNHGRMAVAFNSMFRRVLLKLI